MFGDYYYSGTPTLPTNTTPVATTYEDVVLSLSPTAYYKMNEASGDLADSSGNGHTLTASGLTYQNTGWATYTGAYSVGMSGTDYLTAADHDDWDVGTNDYSLVWVAKVSTTWPGTARYIWTHQAGNLGSLDIYYRAVEDYLRIDHIDATSGSQGINIQTGANELDPGSLTWCALTVDRDNVATLYINGNTTSYSASCSASSAYDLTNARPLYIGVGNTSGYLPLEGDICEVAFWNGTLLTSGQVGSLYDAR